MLDNAFEAASRLIMSESGDQPLVRIVEAAKFASDCPLAFISFRQNGVRRILVSSGFPFMQYRPTLSLSSAATAMLDNGTLIEDATDVAGMEDSWLFAQGWRFFINIPLPLHALGFPVSLTCCDRRVGIERPPDMMERLKICAAIAADELQLIGEIATQTAEIVDSDGSASLIIDAVNQARIPIMLVDDRMETRAISPRLAEYHVHEREMLLNRPLSTDYFFGDETVLARIGEVLDTGVPFNGVTICTSDGDRRAIVDVHRCEAHDGARRFAVVTVSEPSIAARGICNVRDCADSPVVISHFLRSTLTFRTRMLRRGAVSYYAVARWRASVRELQISALKAIKRDPGDYFIGWMADDLVGAARTLFGDKFDAVVAVPCGNSGEHCLIDRVAARVAEGLGVPKVDAFATLPPSGGSHPKSNTRRTAMRLLDAPSGSVLLLDDVATSGAHIEEAATLLRKQASFVLPLVWVAA